MKTEIPVAFETDVLIVGGSCAAVSAALEARKSGTRVMCISAYSYLGEDIAATMRYHACESLTQTAAAGFEQSVWNTVATLYTGNRLSPRNLKYTLEKALLDANVQFLFMCRPYALLRDGNGKTAGLVMANRSGLQAISAKVIIDATERALVGRMSGAEFLPFKPSEVAVSQVVIGAAPEEDDLSGLNQVEVKELPAVQNGREGYPAWEVMAKAQIKDAHPDTLARAEAEMRTKTWHPAQVLLIDKCLMLLPDRLKAGATVDAWTSAEKINLEAFKVSGQSLYILGASASVSDGVAVELMKPVNAIGIGKRIGQAAANDAKSPARIEPLTAFNASNVSSKSSAQKTVSLEKGLSICRKDQSYRYQEKKMITVDLDGLLPMEEMDLDVVVVGGGTGGAPAAVSAARAGGKTVLLENLFQLGGIMTEGRIASYYYGNKDGDRWVGFSNEVDEGVYAMGPNPEYTIESSKWNTEWKKEWYLKEAHMAGVGIWFGSLCVATVMDGSRVAGVVASTPNGLVLLRAGCVVDSTGCADVVASAGGPTVIHAKDHMAVQGTGLSPVNPERHYYNTDYLFVDDTDPLDVTYSFVLAHAKFENEFDISQIVNSRERRQIIGEFTLDPLDFLANRTYPDTVVTMCSNFDSHGFTIHPVFIARAPDHDKLVADVPYRCLIAQELDGVLATGLGISAHRDALPLIRMQPDVQNQGYAAGLAAVMSAKLGGHVREIDMAVLQKALQEKGILKAETVGGHDNFPLPKETVEKSVQSELTAILDVAVVMGNANESVPLMKAALNSATGARRVKLAVCLGLLAENAGVDILIETVQTTPWDKGWHYTGMGQYGFTLSPLDAAIVALSRTKSKKASAVLLTKLKTLSTMHEFSHIRAMAMAFEEMPDKKAAAVFANLLRQDGMAGHARAFMKQATENIIPSETDTTIRNHELKEIFLARGMVACGDDAGLGESTLQAYANDTRSLYARHARAVLTKAGAAKNTKPELVAAV